MIALKSIGKCEGGFWGNVGKGKCFAFWRGNYLLSQ